jgi:hypothetical protein
MSKKDFRDPIAEIIANACKIGDPDEGLPAPEERRLHSVVSALFGLLRSVAKAKAARAKEFEIARNLQELGVSWDIITDATDVRPDELEKLEK